MTHFEASVQYNDLRGSVAADIADGNDISMWLKARGKIKDGEYVIGISMFAGENHGVHSDPVNVTFLVSGLKGYENIPEMLQSTNEPIAVKKIDEDMNIADFLALFKRFNVTLSYGGTMDGKTFKTD